MPKTNDEWMWWVFGTVILGITVSVVSNFIYAYIKPKIDHWWAEQSVENAEKRIVELQEELQELTKYNNDFELFIKTQLRWIAYVLFFFAQVGFVVSLCLLFIVAFRSEQQPFFVTSALDYFNVEKESILATIAFVGLGFVQAAFSKSVRYSRILYNEVKRTLFFVEFKKAREDYIEELKLFVEKQKSQIK